MKLIACMLDLAREQSPRTERLIRILRDCRAAGYNAVGLYLEHRFAYASAPWAAGPGCLTTEAARLVQDAGRELGIRVIPFINTLGHLEGFLRTAEGAALAETTRGLTLQLCPSLPAARDFARGLIADTLATFDDPLIHLGGDEAHHLGTCARCKPIAEHEGAWRLYADHYAALCGYVLEQGRRPALWADMVLKHPEALEALPRETLLFDWQYEHGPAETAPRLQAAGFEVVVCPSVHAYDSAWCFLELTQDNVDAHAAFARERGAAGVCVTTWEFCFFSECFSTLLVLGATGRRIARGESWADALASVADEDERAAMEILGKRVPAADPFLAPGTWRNLRRALVYTLDPFALWRAWPTAAGAAGDAILALLDEAGERIAPEHALQWPIALHRAAIAWVRAVHAAARRYEDGDRAAAVAALSRGATVLEELRPRLRRIAEQGGSHVDVTRLGRLVQRVWDVIANIEQLPAAGVRPAFSVLADPRYVPGSQAGWELGHPVR